MGGGTDLGVVIAGGGVSGICFAIQLQRQLGYTDVVIYEKGTELGGTWHWNRYPGAACDIPMPLYSFSFNQVYWEKEWAPQQQILAYVKDTARKFKVDSKITYRTEVTAARWDEFDQLWVLRIHDLDTGKEFTKTAKVFISCIGLLGLAREIDTPGVGDFKGTITHSSSYDESLDLHGKNVVVLGNGCSGVQIVPAIASTAKTVTQFGRTRHWYFPRPAPTSPSGVQTWLLRHFSLFRMLKRWAIFWVCEEQFKLMDAAKGQTLRDQWAAVSKAYIQQVAPARLREFLVPDFEVGQKRRVFDSEWMQALNEENVSFHPENISKITERGVVKADGTEVPADVIIAATGFVMNKLFYPLDIKGVDGEDMQAHLAEAGGPFAYFATMFSGMPNFACINGPNSATGHSSVIFTTECQVNFAIRVLKPVLQGYAGSVAVTRTAEERYFQWLRRLLPLTVWESKTKKVKAWYNDENGRCTTLYPKSQVHFWWRSVFVRYADFSYLSPAGRELAAWRLGWSTAFKAMSSRFWSAIFGPAEVKRGSIAL